MTCFNIINLFSIPHKTTNLKSLNTTFVTPLSVINNLTYLFPLANNKCNLKTQKKIPQPMKGLNTGISATNTSTKHYLIKKPSLN